jgi:serine protease AprX
MPGYDDYEVGSGYINSYAAVDKAFNRNKGYQSMQEVAFNAEFGEERLTPQTFHIDFSPEVSGPASANATSFTVQPNVNLLDVYAAVDTSLEEGTGNLVGIRITSPSGVNYSTAINTPVIGSSARQITVDNPEAGTWTLEVRGARGLTAVEGVSSPMQAALPGPVDGTVSEVRYSLPMIEDLNGHPDAAGIERAIKDRLIDIESSGKFFPDEPLTRGALANSMMLNSALRQSLGSTPKFSDVSGSLSRIAESISANGPTLRDYDFASTGMMTGNGGLFDPTANATRLDAVVALIKALGRDREARALSNTDVLFEGVVLSDNAQIPAALRGYVQLAIDYGIFQPFPAEVIEIAPGQFEVRPGPRFEPNSVLSRGKFAIELNTFHQLFTTGG